MYEESNIWPLYKRDLDIPISVPKNSEKITKSLEKITATPEIWFNRPLFRDHYKNLRLADLSLEEIHVFGKQMGVEGKRGGRPKTTRIIFGYVAEIGFKDGEGQFYVNLAQKDVDEYILPGEVKITKGARKNKNFVRPTAI